jgi:hypothetical protein
VLLVLVLVLLLMMPLARELMVDGLGPKKSVLYTALVQWAACCEKRSWDELSELVVVVVVIVVVVAVEGRHPPREAAEADDRCYSLELLELISKAAAVEPWKGLRSVQGSVAAASMMTIAPAEEWNWTDDARQAMDGSMGKVELLVM